MRRRKIVNLKRAAGMPKEQTCYVYCVIQEREPQRFEIVGFGGQKDRIHTIHFKDLAAVVGRPPESGGVVTREAAIAHEKVIEEVMKRYPVLPLSFGVAARAKAVQQKLLGERFDEFHEALARIAGKTELDLKAFWLNRDEIFQEVAQALQITRSESASYAHRIAIGERVAQMIVQKKEHEADAIVAPLRSLAEETVEQETHGDRMVLNCAFLVRKKHEAAFDKAVAHAAAEHEGRLKFKYVLSPPYNFVNLHLALR